MAIRTRVKTTEQLEGVCDCRRSLLPVRGKGSESTTACLHCCTQRLHCACVLGLLSYLSLYKTWNFVHSIRIKDSDWGRCLLFIWSQIQSVLAASSDVHDILSILNTCPAGSGAVYQHSVCQSRDSHSAHWPPTWLCKVRVDEVLLFYFH